MSEDKQVTPEKLSLKQLLGTLSVGQLRAVIGAVVVLVGGSFGFGMLVNEVRLSHSYQSKLEDMITKEEHQNHIESLTQKHSEQIDEEKKKAEKLDKLNKRYTLQIEFLERSNAYLNARIKGKEDALNGDWVEDVKTARDLFALTLKRIYKGGDRNLQKAEGYEFDESEAGNHKVIFGDVKPYRIPRDVKGDFIDQLR